MSFLVDIRSSRAIHRESISWAAGSYIVSRSVWHRAHACHARVYARMHVRSAGAREPGLASEIYANLCCMRVLSTTWSICARQDVVRDFTAVTMNTHIRFLKTKRTIFMDPRDSCFHSGESGSCCNPTWFSFPHRDSIPMFLSTGKMQMRR